MQDIDIGQVLRGLVVIGSNPNWAFCETVISKLVAKDKLGHVAAGQSRVETKSAIQWFGSGIQIRISDLYQKMSQIRNTLVAAGLYR
jgi:hypothetical protein